VLLSEYWCLRAVPRKIGVPGQKSLKITASEQHKLQPAYDLRLDYVELSQSVLHWLDLMQRGVQFKSRVCKSTVR